MKKLSKLILFYIGLSFVFGEMRFAEACYLNISGYESGWCPAGFTFDIDYAGACGFPPYKDSNFNYWFGCKNNACSNGCCYTNDSYFGMLSQTVFCPEGPFPPPPLRDGPPPNNSCEKKGSVIRVDTQSVAETIPLVGVPFALVYTSERVAGRISWYKSKIPVTSSSYSGDPSITAETIQIQIAGQTITKSYTPAAGLSYSLTWNGKDNAGKPIVGSQLAAVTLGETYVTPPSHPAPLVYAFALGVLTNEQVGLGGWDISIHHQYDPVRKILQLGSGEAYNTGFDTISNGYRVVSENGDEVYLFDSTWKHYSTLFGLTGTTKSTFVYTSGKLASVVDASGNTTTFNYTSGRISSITAPFSQITSISTDSNGYISRVTNPNSESHYITSYSTGLLHTFEKPTGAITTMVYDSDGYLIGDSSTAGNSTTLFHSEIGSNAVISATSALGRVDTFTLTSDNFGYNRAFSSARGGSGTYNHALDATQELFQSPNFTDQKMYSSDARFGGSLKFANFENININGIPKSISRSQTFVPNVSGDPFSINMFTENETVNSKTTSRVYAGSTKAFVTTSPVGRVNTRIIDSKERTTSLQHAGLTPITFIYDTHGRLTQAAQGVSRATTLSYNSGTGFLNSIANSKSEVWRFGYDPSGRVTSITLPDTRAISYGYDSNGNVTSITPPGKAAHSSLFNFFDLISSYLPPLLGGVTSTPTTYSYNNDRQLTQVVRPDSQTITFNYGSTTGTLDSIVQPTGTSTFTYSSGDLVTTTSPDAITHTLGNYGGLTFTEALTYAPSTQTSLVIYNYNSDYLKSEEQVNTSNTTGTNYLFAYDNDGLITSAGDEALTRSGSTGAVTQAAIGTNMKTLFGYSSEYGELSQIQGKYGAAVKYQEDLTRDSLGRLSSRTEKYGSLTNVYGYTYDSAGRLTNVSLNSAAYSTYSYDTNSNRTRQTVSAVTKSPTYDSQDRLSTFGTKAFSYNTNGERTRVVDSSMTPSQATIFAYNSFGDLKTVTLPGAVTVTYHLDAHGRRVAKKKGSTYNAYYVYGKDDKILSVLSSIGAVTMRFI